MWVCPAAAAWGPSRRPTAVDVVWRLTRRFSAGRRRARGVGRVCGAMSAARPPARALRPQASAGFVIQRLQLLGRRDAREPRFLHPALGNEGGELWLQCWLQRGRWRRTLGGLRFDECVSGRHLKRRCRSRGVGARPFNHAIGWFSTSCARLEPPAGRIHEETARGVRWPPHLNSPASTARQTTCNPSLGPQ